eukprot:TRINITY_DN1159_c2_g1_i1.p1 TRINITY_DN1159_c2_g1~~TRINITY_DN1159_c2_g1_i1.p1  ORF type:complete len:598 (+),score=143.99 TRINITY_DN1159_c2_g1_i1:75-1868(+)
MINDAEWSWLHEQRELLSNSLAEDAEKALEKAHGQWKQSGGEMNGSYKGSQQMLWISVQKAEIGFWKITLSDSEEQLDPFTRTVDEAIALSEGLYEKCKVTMFSSITRLWNSPSQLNAEEKYGCYLESAIALGELNLMLATAHMRFHNYIRGGLYLRKGWKYIEEAFNSVSKQIQASDQNGDGSEDEITASRSRFSFLTDGSGKEQISAHSLYLQCKRLHLCERATNSLLFDVGIFHFFLSMIPDTLSTLVEVIGFHADRDHGIALLEHCFVDDGYRGPSAVVPLAVAYHSSDGNWARGIQAFQFMIDKYPDNVVLHYMMGIMSRQNGEMDKSSYSLERAAELCLLRGYTQLHLSASYESAHNDFLLHKWDLAAPRIERFLRETKSKQFRAYGSFKLGLCYLMTGKDDDTVTAYRRMQDWVRPSMNFDAYAKRRSLKYLKTRKFTQSDRIYFQASLYNDAFKFEEALQFVQEFESTKENPASNEEGFITPSDAEILMAYTKAYALAKLKRNEEAKSALEYILLYGDSVDDEKHVLPYAYVLLAEMALSENNLDECEYYLGLASNQRGYDFEKILRIQMKSLQKNLKNKQATKASTTP